MIRFNSLHARIILLFFSILFIILFITLFFVRQETFGHSNRLVNSQIETAQNVVRYRLNQAGETLVYALGTISKDSDIKDLFFKDRHPPSLSVALDNHKNRVNADIVWATDPTGVLLTNENQYLNDLMSDWRDSYNNENLQIVELRDSYYLVKAATVKRVERSRNPPSWIYMGFDLNKLINEELRELAGMDITLFSPPETLSDSDSQSTNNLVLASTSDQVKQQSLKNSAIDFSEGYHSLTIANSPFIYNVAKVAQFHGATVYAFISINEEQAFLTYNNFIIQLVVILLAASALVLFAATLLSNGITQPLRLLVDVADRIRQGQYQQHLPKSSTQEVSILSDAIESMQEGIQSREQSIHELAYYDKLTGLPNRNHFQNEINARIAANAKDTFAVLLIDVDRFKEVNDTMGHPTGDKLLMEVASRLMNYSQTGAFFARIGGDEFGVIIPDMENVSLAPSLERFCSIFDMPFVLDNLTLDVDVSIGVAIFPEHGNDALTLMQSSDIALYSAKGHHGHFVLYEEALNKHTVLRLSLMSELRSAIANGQLELYYQPKMHIESEKIIMTECLVRWNHPEHGFIRPDDFIPLAEQTGAIRDVTKWAIATAFDQQRDWRSRGIEIGVAVNISALDLVDLSLPSYVAEQLSAFNAQPQMLTLEVTESAVMDDPDSALRALNMLRHMGVKLSIDDFGTGYSSMSQLKKMPVDELKIDKAFVMDLPHNEDDQVITRTTIALGHSMGMKIVAEGVEDKASLTLLKEYQCDIAQGYYLSKPLPAQEFERWLNSFNKVSES